MVNLLYRYFSPSWLFKDASKGNLWERAAALRHNEEQRPHLLTYMKRWFILSLILYFISLPFDGWILASALLTLSVIAFATAILLASLWLRLGS
jgi:hypothetical protein